MVENGKKYLITTNDWFFGPDGENYKAVWGTCYVKNIKEVFGFDPIRPSTNWYLVVGKENKEVIIAGCQIHYAVRCEKMNNKLLGVTFLEKDTGVVRSADRIYIAE
jgi:hypothetical protein